MVSFPRARAVQSSEQPTVTTIEGPARCVFLLEAVVTGGVVSAGGGPGGSLFVGGDSSSKMVPRALPSPIVPLAGDDSETISDSSLSSAVSPFTGTVI